jgi:hypothetical protein
MTRNSLNLLDKLRKLDLFGEPISLTFHRERTFKTLWGSFFTCSLVVIVLIESVVQISKLVVNEQLAINESTSFIDLTKSENKIDLSKTGFNLGLGFSGKELDPRIGTW